MSTEEPLASQALIDRFCAAHRLPQHFALMATDHYLPFVQKILAVPRGSTYVVGVTGSQGSGKSTLADLIRWIATERGWNTAVLSLDDFYLTQNQRQELAVSVHPLLRTRGVPGTHDTALLRRVIAELKGLGAGESLALPRFDKLADNPLPGVQWPKVNGPIDLILLEGWCLGAQPQTEDELERPLNELEAADDLDGSWRRWVNQQLRLEYLDIWSEIDLLAFMRIPDFSLVLEWRNQQEQQLARNSDGTKSPMTIAQLQRFVQHYQRITQHNLQRLPEIADVIFDLNSSHQIIQSRYRHV